MCLLFFQGQITFNIHKRPPDHPKRKKQKAAHKEPLEELLEKFPYLLEVSPGTYLHIYTVRHDILFLFPYLQMVRMPGVQGGFLLVWLILKLVVSGMSAATTLL
jgi:hypothetical protein